MLIQTPRLTGAVDLRAAPLKAYAAVVTAAADDDLSLAAEESAASAVVAVAVVAVSVSALDELSAVAEPVLAAVGAVAAAGSRLYDVHLGC